MSPRTAFALVCASNHSGKRPPPGGISPSPSPQFVPTPYQARALPFVFPCSIGGFESVVGALAVGSPSCLSALISFGVFDRGIFVILLDFGERVAPRSVSLRMVRACRFPSVVGSPWACVACVPKYIACLSSWLASRAPHFRRWMAQISVKRSNPWTGRETKPMFENPDSFTRDPVICLTRLRRAIEMPAV